MAKGIAAIQLRKVRGKFEIQGLGRTPRGQRFVRGIEKMKATRTTDPEFKGELATAVGKLLS